MTVPIYDPSDDHYELAVTRLRAGKLVAFPSETVYGLGADASQEDAVLRIFNAKNRPADHPLIVHIAGVDCVSTWAKEVSPQALRLMEHFWPGPLTIILPKADSVSPVVTGGQDSIGLRCPAHPVALALLQRFKGGVAGPSANKFGRISPTRAKHVAQEFGDEVSMVLDGGAAQFGIESTIVDMTGDQAVILRLGFISKEAIERVLMATVLTSQDVKSSLRVSGSLAAHYAPRTPMRLYAEHDLDKLDWQRYAHQKLGLWSTCKPAAFTGRWLAAPQQATEYAHELYASLRYFDNLDLDLILVQTPPRGGLWDAVHDRLGRAVVGSGIQTPL